MDRYRKPNKKHAKSLDGFVQPFSSNPENSPNLQAFNQYYSGQKHQPQPAAPDRIDDFRQPEGFQASENTPITQPGDQYKPYELGMESAAQEVKTPRAKKRRRLFSLFRRKKNKQEKTRAKHRKLKLSLRLAGALTALIILVGGGLALKGYLKARNIFKGGEGGSATLNNKNVDPTLLKGEGDGRVNILILGKGGPGHDGPDLTDTLLVASIDPIAKEAALVSVPRDLWVKTTATGSSKINSVYANAKYAILNNYPTRLQTDAIKEQAEKAGVKAVEGAISNTLGIPLHYYVMVDFEAFRQSIDAVGGIDINVKTQLYDPSIAWENNWNPLIAAVGNQHFDGKKALLYARSRHGSARGDFDRAERQREIIVALKSKILSLGTFSNPIKINQLIDAFGNHIETDFSLNEIMRVYDLAKVIDGSKIQSIGLADPPNDYVTTDNINGLSVVVPKAGIYDYTAIHNYIRNILKDAFLKSENANIMILNGTDTAGLATLKSTELKSYGYNVTQVGDAPTKAYTKTVLVDLTKGSKKYTKTYLEKRLGVTATTSLPDKTISPGTANFVIILGSNEPSATQ